MNDDHSPRETRAAAKARRREEAEIRNAKPAISLPERTETTEIVEWDCHSLLSDGAA